jgi:hypothetical protein
MNPGAQERLRFWTINAEMASMALQKVAPDGDYTNLVVVVADMRDDIARILIEAMGAKHNFDIQAHEKKTERKGEIPTGVLVLEVSLTESLCGVLDHPTIAQNLERVPAPGHVRAIVISSGAVMLLHPPVLPMPSVGQS